MVGRCLLAIPEHDFFIVIIIHVWCISFPLAIIQPEARGFTCAVGGYEMNIVLSLCMHMFFQSIIVIMMMGKLFVCAYAEHTVIICKVILLDAYLGHLPDDLARLG